MGVVLLICVSDFHTYFCSIIDLNRGNESIGAQIMQSGAALLYTPFKFMYIHIHTTQIGLAMLVTFKIPTYLGCIYKRENFKEFTQ